MNFSVEELWDQSVGPHVKVTFPADSTYMMNRYQSAVELMKPILEKEYKRKVGDDIYYISNYTKNYCYTLYSERKIVYNTASYSLKFFGPSATWLSKLKQSGNEEVVINTLIMDNTVHEMTHLMTETIPSLYSSDPGYRETIEHIVKLNTLETIKRNYDTICMYWGMIDTVLLTIMHDQYKLSHVYPATGRKLISPYVK